MSRVKTVEKPVLNIADAPLQEFGDGRNFVARKAVMGKTLGLEGMGCSFHVVPPGKRAYPFHRHHVLDEFFFIVSGSGEYRVGERRLPLRMGDCIGAPAGGEAHQIINNGDEELRYLALSTMGSADILEYPDSGKIALGGGIQNADFSTNTIFKVGRLTPAGYYEGED
ncbi:MAG TPA: cupin domain-containing protein [Rhizomicrobium sp.]|nr:cupin domain-containing protein [Rhizomicrobium sp.]